MYPEFGGQSQKDGGPEEERVIRKGKLTFGNYEVNTKQDGGIKEPAKQKKHKRKENTTLLLETPFPQ